MAFTDDQIMALNAAPNTPDTMFGNPRGSPFSALWGGGGVGGPMGQFAGFGGLQQSTPLSPFRTAMAGSIAPTDANLWDKLTNLLGSGKTPGMPGATIGAPAGQAAPAPPPPMRLPGQMPTPPGMGAYFHAMQNPAQGGGLMAQYMALQRLMQGG